MSNIDIIKGVSMIVMFSLTMITGNIPLRVKTFKENQKLLALASAFSGGLFLSVGLIHILPEAAESFDQYYDSQEASESISTTVHSAAQANANEEKTSHFPFQMLIAVLSFSLVLFIEKVIGNNSQHHHHGHEHGENHNQTHTHNNKNIQQDDIEKSAQFDQKAKENSDCKKQISKEDNIIAQNQNTCQLTSQMKFNSKSQNLSESKTQNNERQQDNENQIIIEMDNLNKIEQLDINKQPSILSPLQNDTKQINQNKSYSSSDEEINEKKKQATITKVFQTINIKMDANKDHNTNAMTPYVLQLAFGIHATLEGLAIGVENNFSNCLAIALAVLAHKWAEGMVMGLAMKNASLSLKRSTLMIALQAIMNPIGIGIGWALSDAGNLTSGILMSISAGTFVYIATNEVIAEEFSKSRYAGIKFLFYLIGIGFISSLWFLEQVTE